MNRGSGGSAAHRPYVGLRAFRADDAYRFFGRARAAHDLAAHWQANRLTILHGPSGAGKTSLLQAGVLPLLDPETTDTLPVGRVSYGSAFPVVDGAIYPAAALPPQHNPHVFALLTAWAPNESPARLAGLTLEGYLRSRPARQDPYGDPMPVLLAIDQAEELFDGFTHRQVYREWFLDQLKRALEADRNLRLLMCVRDDHLASIMPYGRKLAANDHRRLRLDAFDPDEAREAITGPVRGTGRVYDRSAVDRLLSDLAADSPPGDRRAEPVRLQAACSMVWRSLPPGVRTITEAHVGDIAATDKQVTTYCELMVREVAAAHLDGDTGRLLSWLARTFVTQLVTRRRVRVRENVTVGMDNAIVEALVRRDILLRDAEWCELSHDRLIQPILQAAGPVDLSASGSDPDDLLGSAELALRDRDLEQAKTRARAAFDRVRGDRRLEAEIHTFLGNIAHQEQEYASSIDHYLRAAELFESLSAFDAVGRLLVGMGWLRLAQGRSDLAVEELNIAQGRYSHDLSIKTAFAWALWHDGAPALARDTVTDVLEQDGDAHDALQARGEFLASMGESEAAFADLERAGPLQWPSTKAAHALAAARLAEAPEPASAIREEIREALEDAPDSGPVWLYSAWINLVQAEHDPADETIREHARRALKARSPALPRHLRDEARRLAASGDR
ncbi:tetratricopeptide repeat protein [Herbidospora galbida]|uniref:Tetratricopeptide repeat protein n=1 Tax=Herbidospora galbida TaxID=2575442 RepID=A0A4U3MK90_9ACTN|nr:tetratricopeptide repeat protein [Herbidospora galbida]TKK89310.1 tetratricopeptide repeat protein [Herbidospora galbida]